MEELERALLENIDAINILWQVGPKAPTGLMCLAPVEGTAGQLMVTQVRLTQPVRGAGGGPGGREGEDTSLPQSQEGRHSRQQGEYCAEEDTNYFL